MAKPTIVVVPGTWHVPAHFDPVTKELESAGYTVVGVSLPGNSDEPYPNNPPNMQDDISAVRTTLLTQLETSNVLLITHSWGSIVGAAALTALSTTARTAANHTTSVVALILISGFIVPPGLTSLEITGGKPLPQYLLSESGLSTLPFAGPGPFHLLYNDLAPTEAAKAIHLLRPQSYACLTSQMPDQVAAIGDIPMSYLCCSEDHALPWERQVGSIEGFREKGVRVVRTLVARSGHSPFLSVPEATARFVRLVAGEGVETGFEELKADGSKPS
ncbi:hypothetical protein PRZ48_009058 [Zasmidium cellare]|uniref:AB hydrolase-1 domain-containing protein n=1 Tax=Zasmidium cellare TaxID=395010 RepID=A0ABR0EH75_ZASCE|nr:hypothetical protein PRZ48_009058 [Zasmidium cellare]